MSMNHGGSNPMESCEERFARWFADGDTTACVFENKDLGHPQIGRRVAFPYTKANAEAMAIGTSRAPDSSLYGLGWRYILVARCNTVEEAMAALDEDRQKA